MKGGGCLGLMRQQRTELMSAAEHSSYAGFSKTVVCLRQGCSAVHPIRVSLQLCIGQIQGQIINQCK